MVNYYEIPPQKRKFKMEKIENKEEKRKKIIIFRLREILAEKGISQAEACRLTGLTPPEMARLVGLGGIIFDDSREMIQFSTIGKLCNGLGIKIEYLMALEEPSFLSLVKAEGRPFTITVGSRPCLLLKPDDDRIGATVRVGEGERRDAIGIWDMRALGEITRQCPWYAPIIGETPCTLTLAENNMPETVSRLLRTPEGGVVIGLGSPLVSGLADFVLLEIMRHYELPFRFWWDFFGGDSRRYHRYVGPGNPQGILWNRELRVQIPAWQEIRDYPQGERYTDGCVIVIWPTVSSLFRMGHIKYPGLAVKLRDSQDPLSQYLREQFSPDTQRLLDGYDGESPPSEELQKALVDELNRLLQGDCLYDRQRFGQVELTEEQTSEELRWRLEKNPQGDALIHLNRLLLEAAYPDEIATIQRTIKRRTWVALVMGFMGSGTAAGASFLFSDDFGNILSEYLADPAVTSDGEDPAPPLFVALKVTCEKRGSRGSREVYPVKTDVVGNHFDHFNADEMMTY
jgi:transcriptional regulator with XRE-family HTH domain